MPKREVNKLVNRCLSIYINCYNRHLSDICRKVYTQKLDDNPFEPLLPETEKNFKDAGGEELTGDTYSCKMQFSKHHL